LIRSAAYRAADLADRRAIHRVLADVTDPESDPDRRAWHAANAAAGPDDSVAAELETSAGRAQSRGGIAAAAAFLERATALTVDPAQRVARAIAAAQAKVDAAAPDAAYDLLAIAEMGSLSDSQRAQVARLRAQLDFARNRGGDPSAPPLRKPASQLLDAAKHLETHDDDLSRETYFEALAAAIYAGRLAEPDALPKAAEAVRAAVGPASQLHQPMDLLLSGMAHRIAGAAGDGHTVPRSALELICAETNSQVLRWMSLAFPVVQETLAAEIWDDAIYRQLATDIVRHARDAGALAIIPRALAYQARAHVMAGEFATAATIMEEAASINAATGSAPATYDAVYLAAWRGNSADAVGLIESATAEGHARGEGRLLGLAGFVAALLYNGLGRYEEAFAAAREACEHEDLGFYGWCLIELVEAAVHTGERATAASAIDQLEERAGASGTDWGLGILASSKALLADDETAENLFTEAIERLERTSIAVHLARAHLRYGEWLRRLNRRLDARRHLTEAHTMFTRMGANAFAERARRELATIGEKVRKQPVSSGDELTAQEAQIARLAAEGLTNPEIGAQLFISTHTVEWHLRKVFVKLGITSRRQLRTVSWAS
jgi:DNA-binding CsgD family transcriptional regulator/tetratricopeptide (TPR) repeat protein